MKQNELELIRLLSLEDKAKVQEKSAPFLVLSILFLTFLGLGLYYWFGQDFIFSYSDISPFWGFVIFTIFGFILDCIIDKMYSLYWHDYNRIIKDANKEILEIIESGNEGPLETIRLKKDYIERKIGKELLTKEEFDWHTTNYCWGCGKKHSSKPIVYHVHRERTVRWKEGAFWYTKTFHKSSSIQLCPECYNRLNSANKQSKKNLPYQFAIAAILGIGSIYGSYQIWGEDEAWICAIIIFLGGYWVIFGLSFLICSLFLKSGDSSSKWSFNEIPEIRIFLNQELPHTKN
ncbi:MAG: hypothetical protein IIW53_01790 [Rikenellaceae bacterium]|nr:hypothetical protein [Rikenellaceae bacterium]